MGRSAGYLFGFHGEGQKLSNRKGTAGQDIGAVDRGHGAGCGTAQSGAHRHLLAHRDLQAEGKADLLEETPDRHGGRVFVRIAGKLAVVPLHGENIDPLVFDPFQDDRVPRALQSKTQHIETGGDVRHGRRRKHGYGFSAHDCLFLFHS